MKLMISVGSTSHASVRISHDKELTAFVLHKSERCWTIYNVLHSKEKFKTPTC